VSAWLEIVGVTESETPVVADGRTVIGPKRLLDRLDGSRGRRIDWQLKLDVMLAQVAAHRGTPTTILASGDPLWFGIGATLLQHLDANEVRFTPTASSFQFAAARLRWPLQHVTTLSLHARPAELIHPHIAPGNRILALTSDAITAPHVARLLVERGYPRSVLTVLENLGAQDERIVSAEAVGFDLAIGDFYVLAVDCAADPGAPLLSAVPGLPDDAFVSDGQLTKREVRAATLAKLAPYPGALLWDIGAGCGSVAIEWMRAARDAKAIAFEREGERLQMIAVNARNLGTPTLRIENGSAPDSLAGMPQPDAVFLGGGVASEALFHAAWTALRSGGRFVANAVTLDGEQALYDCQARLGGHLVRLDVAALDNIGDHRALRPRRTVTQWSSTKP
jgi:precorrin-6Y C5,15-methyltransferase (decarboxylating)